MPWDDPTVRAFIDEWLNQQDRCVKGQYPGWLYRSMGERMCGNTGSTVIHCDNPPDDSDGYVDNFHYLWIHNWRPQYYPYRVQGYVKERKAGASPDSLAICKPPFESCY
jgi:hypothetical protein